LLSFFVTSKPAMSGDEQVSSTIPSAVNGFESQDQVLELILDSWDAVNKTGEYAIQNAGTILIETKEEKKVEKENKNSGSWFSWGTKIEKNSYDKEVKADEKNGKKNPAGETQFDIPDTFSGMVKINASMTGANLGYIEIMLDEFNNMVRDTCKLGQLQEQTDILALRIAKDVKGTFKTSEFKVCMLAAMRSLIPQRWDTAHEKAWAWIWESIDTQLKLSLALPAKYEMPVNRFIKDQMDPATLGDIGLKVWYRMFVKEPKVEDVFKQSNERLKWIAVQAMLYSAEIYRDPTGMNTRMQQLGLKHIMFRVNPSYFSLFVQCIDEELRERIDDENVVNGINWSLTIIACILARTVEAGSSPLLIAALNNNVKALKAELQAQPRGKRGMSMLSA